MLSFVKYQGAGNDFILIDDRALRFSPHLVPALCHRKFGIGADGLILLQNDAIASFRMRIFNSDGTEAASCGNGLRCLARFLLHLGFPPKPYSIATRDRIVQVDFIGDKISLQMGSALHLRIHQIAGYEVHSLDTGVPHAVVFAEADLLTLGPHLRSHPVFQPAGTNVNLARIAPDHSIQMRTYERGVEGETLSCGTGAAAVAFIASHHYHLPNPIQIHALGGSFEVRIDGHAITLLGDALEVFEGVFPLISALDKISRSH